MSTRHLIAAATVAPCFLLALLAYLAARTFTDDLWIQLLVAVTAEAALLGLAIGILRHLTERARRPK